MKAAPNAFYSFDPYIPPYQQFDHATRNLMSIIDCQAHDKERIRQFLCSFAEHVVENITPIDLDRKAMREIIERIPDMELAE